MILCVVRVVFGMHGNGLGRACWEMYHDGQQDMAF